MANFCTACGNKLNAEDKFCSHCGNKVKTNTATTNAKETSSSITTRTTKVGDGLLSPFNTLTNNNTSDYTQKKEDNSFENMVGFLGLSIIALDKLNGNLGDVIDVAASVIHDFDMLDIGDIADISDVSDLVDIADLADAADLIDGLGLLSLFG